VEETTTVRLTAVRLASVRLDKGPLIIARLEDDAQGMTRVSLYRDDHGAIWARLAQAADGGAD
jgi:hypothetical protein